MTGEKSYGKIMMEAFARAIPWAIVFSLTVVITAKLLAPQVKGAIFYTINAAVNTALRDDIFPKVKQNAKEAIEFTVSTVDNRLVKPYSKRK